MFWGTSIQTKIYELRNNEVKQLLKRCYKNDSQHSWRLILNLFSYIHCKYSFNMQLFIYNCSYRKYIFRFSVSKRRDYTYSQSSCFQKEETLLYLLLSIFSINNLPNNYLWHIHISFILLCINTSFPKYSQNLLFILCVHKFTLILKYIIFIQH